jgi:integrase
MPVRRDKRTGAWIFQATVKFADGTRKRIFGTPGIVGPYHDLARTRVGAIEAERRAISEALLGKPLVAAPALEAPKGKTIREHSETFSETYKPESKPSTKRDRQLSIRHLMPWFGDLTIEQLKQSDIGAYVASELKRGVSRKTINCRLATLSSLIRFSTGEKPKLRLNTGGKPTKIQAVEPADVERLLDACKDARYRAVILLAYEAGLRAGEIRGLQWTDIKDGQLTIRRALDKDTGASLKPKHDKERTVPLSSRIIETLATLPRRALWVVCRPDGCALNYDELNHAVNALYARSKVTRPLKPLHCLRHTFGTVMARRAPLPVLRDLMGHEEISTTMRYVDVGEADKRAAIAAVFGVSKPVANVASHMQAAAN